jgi:hypothetical protein
MTGLETAHGGERAARTDLNCQRDSVPHNARLVADVTRTTTAESNSDSISTLSATGQMGIRKMTTTGLQSWPSRKRNCFAIIGTADQFGGDHVTYPHFPQ